MQLLVPEASFTGHLCGILAGVIQMAVVPRLLRWWGAAPRRHGGASGSGGGGRTYGRGTWGGGGGGAAAAGSPGAAARQRRQHEGAAGGGGQVRPERGSGCLPACLVAGWLAGIGVGDTILLAACCMPAAGCDFCQLRWCSVPPLLPGSNSLATIHPPLDLNPTPHPIPPPPAFSTERLAGDGGWQRQRRRPGSCRVDPGTWAGGFDPGGSIWDRSI